MYVTVVLLPYYLPLGHRFRILTSVRDPAYSISRSPNRKLILFAINFSLKRYDFTRSANRKPN